MWHAGTQPPNECASITKLFQFVNKCGMDTYVHDSSDRSSWSCLHADPAIYKHPGASNPVKTLQAGVDLYAGMTYSGNGTWLRRLHPIWIQPASKTWTKLVYETLQDGVDPYAGMTKRERKLAELQARLRQSRKANQNAVIAERRREKVDVCLLVSALHHGDTLCDGGTCIDIPRA